MWIFTLSGQWKFGVEEAQRLKVYTGPINNGRFFNGAELICPITTRLVESCLWILVTGAQPARYRYKFKKA